MKIPGPDHPITITPNPNRVRVVFAGRVVADTTRALSLKEASYPAVLYIPREDADLSAFERTSHASHCPYKGDAAYYSLRVGDRRAENAVWTYDTPNPAVAAIREHLAFYPDRVDRIEEQPA
ncbi:DUF427 domain-containing protein [Azospirillum rugosum]|uniref:Uncharacterized protein (DUF427 family) n=1 Tax=Azospirillum rugosum TaxID=416170 RepID=A0ABS4SSA1_9PROT|nr:DUF427 domain-containing protein [Azospirillum rugosum]MBP2295443.1 uncharacterized protein (DUF427 family) [Azospirillum rugosum]MDQ0528322.1 uncharacterized protein (DUF427 family) [Azospirillum rugosum]